MITSCLEEQQHSCSCSTVQVQVVGLQMRLVFFVTVYMFLLNTLNQRFYMA